jgi:hypothetical protein
MQRLTESRSPVLAQAGWNWVYALQYVRLGSVSRSETNKISTGVNFMDDDYKKEKETHVFFGLTSLQIIGFLCGLISFVASWVTFLPNFNSVDGFRWKMWHENFICYNPNITAGLSLQASLNATNNALGEFCPDHKEKYATLINK